MCMCIYIIYIYIFFKDNLTNKYYPNKFNKNFLSLISNMVNIGRDSPRKKYSEVLLTAF